MFILLRTDTGTRYVRVKTISYQAVFPCPVMNVFILLRRQIAGPFRRHLDDDGQAIHHDYRRLS